MGINNNTLVKDNHELGEYHVKLSVKNVVDDFCWGLVIIYCDAQPNGKPTFLVELLHLLKKTPIDLY